MPLVLKQHDIAYNNFYGPYRMDLLLITVTKSQSKVTFYISIVYHLKKTPKVLNIYIDTRQTQQKISGLEKHTTLLTHWRWPNFR